ILSLRTSLLSVTGLNSFNSKENANIFLQETLDIIETIQEKIADPTTHSETSLGQMLVILENNYSLFLSSVNDTIKLRFGIDDPNRLATWGVSPHVLLLGHSKEERKAGSKASLAESRDGITAE